MKTTQSRKWITLNSMLIGNVTKTLIESDLDAEVESCPVCESPASRSSPVLQLQTDPDICRMECSSCKCVYVNRFPTNDYLADFYSRYWDANERRTFINTQRMSRHIAKSMHLKEKDNLRILDFGGGDGEVSLELIRTLKMPTGYVAVIDYNTVPHPNPPTGVVVEHFSPLQNLPQLPGFDVIIASGVLEHIKSLRHTLTDLLKSLAPGGQFYARTPYSMPLNRALRRVGAEFDTNFPGHLWDLGPEFWEQCIPILDVGPDFKLAFSRPSIVESEWRSHPVTTFAATLLKFPWKILGNRYSWVGGWEVVISRSTET